MKMATTQKSLFFSPKCDLDDSTDSSCPVISQGARDEMIAALITIVKVAKPTIHQLLTSFYKFFLGAQCLQCPCGHYKPSLNHF